MVETSMVPATRGRTPKRGVAKRGVHSVPNRKSVMGTSRRNAKVSIARTMMIPAVVPIESSAQRNSAHSMRNSMRFVARRRPAAGADRVVTSDRREVDSPRACSSAGSGRGIIAPWRAALRASSRPGSLLRRMRYRLSDPRSACGRARESAVSARYTQLRGRGRRG